MDRSLTVAQVIGRLNTGGATVQVVDLTRELRHAGHEVTLYAGEVPPHEGTMEDYAHEAGIEPVKVPGLKQSLNPVYVLRAIFFLATTFRQTRPDVVHTHTAMAGGVGRIAAFLARVPAVHTFHGHVLGGSYFSPLKTSVFRVLERMLARISERLIVPSRALKRELSGEYRIADELTFEEIPYGLDLEPYTNPDRRSLRREGRDELGLDSKELVLGMVGRLAPVKNVPLFLESLPRVLEMIGDRSSDVRVLMVGDGEERDRLEGLSKEIGIDDRVRWLGWRDDLPRIYSVLDLLVLTSKDEGSPVALIEALASGTPVVARSVGGVPEVLENGRWGRLVDNADPDELAAAITEVVVAPPAEKTLEAARRSVVERFELQRRREDMLALYRTVRET